MVTTLTLPVSVIVLSLATSFQTLEIRVSFEAFDIVHPH